MFDQRRRNCCFQQKKIKLETAIILHKCEEKKFKLFILALDVTSKCGHWELVHLFTQCGGLFTLSKMIWSKGTCRVFGDGTEQSSCLNLGGGHEDKRLSDLPQVTREVVYLGWIFSPKPSTT